MKTLKSLLEEFNIIGMRPKEIEGESGLEFLDGEAAELGEEEYELDADGNPVLDAEGNPVKKVVAPEGSCKCDHTADPSLAPDAVDPELGELPPEDEFDFKV